MNFKIICNVFKIHIFCLYNILYTCFPEFSCFISALISYIYNFKRLSNCFCLVDIILYIDICKSKKTQVFYLASKQNTCILQLF